MKRAKIATPEQVKAAKVVRSAYPGAQAIDFGYSPARMCPVGISINLVILDQVTEALGLPTSTSVPEAYKHIRAALRVTK